LTKSFTVAGTVSGANAVGSRYVRPLGFVDSPTGDAAWGAGGKMATHLPVNHPLQPLYRILAALAGAYVLAFGIAGVVLSADRPVFDQSDAANVLGLRSNLGFAILSIVVGLVVFGGGVIGGNADHFVNLIGGAIFLGAGLLMMTLLQTNANFLNFQMSTCIVSFVIGLVLLTAGLYGRVGTRTEAVREEHFRTYRAPDPHDHEWAGSEAHAPTDA
jgi:hypothetical protein